jgi:hypothetical protein
MSSTLARLSSTTLALVEDAGRDIAAAQRRASAA